MSDVCTLHCRLFCPQCTTAGRALYARARPKITLFDVIREYDPENARELAKQLPLSDQLRASIVREREKRMAHEDLYNAIEKRRSELQEDLTRMRAERDAYVADVNAKIKHAQDALDDLPVPKTRRSKKAPQPSESV